MLRINQTARASLFLFFAGLLHPLCAQSYSIIPNPSVQSFSTLPTSASKDGAGNVYTVARFTVGSNRSTFNVPAVLKTTSVGLTTTIFVHDITNSTSNTALTVDKAGN